MKDIHSLYAPGLSLSPTRHLRGFSLLYSFSQGHTFLLSKVKSRNVLQLSTSQRNGGIWQILHLCALAAFYRTPLDLLSPPQ